MFRIADHIASAEPVGEGGQLYKALRSDGRISAVQLFPFTITSEQYRQLTEQVNLLTEAAGHHRASVPTILSWGFTQTGNFAFIEREWIEGWSVAELRHNVKSITVDEIGDIAEQMSRVLTLCHSVGVVHGNIISEHILWNKKIQQYSLTGFRFGLPLSEAASKNMKSPITSKGYQSNLSSSEKDVHDLGLVLFQLASGHLLPGNATASTQSVVSISNQTLKDGSTMPAWLAACIERAINTNEEKFSSAHEMYSYIILHHKMPVPANKWYRSKPQQPVAPVKREIKTGRTSRQKIKSAWTSGVKKGREEMRFVFDRHIAIGLLIAGVLAGFSIIAQKRENEKNREARIAMTTSAPQQDTTAAVEEETTETVDKATTQKNSIAVVQGKKKTVTPKKLDMKEKAVEEVPAVTSTGQKENNGDMGSYKVKGKAYFHNEPDEATRRNAFIVHWNNAVLHPLKEENDFVYVVFTNDEGQTSKGWLRKKDLVKL